MKILDILTLFKQDGNLISLTNQILAEEKEKTNTHLKNIQDSQKAILAAHIIQNTKTTNLFVLDGLEDALYFVDDLNNINPKIKPLLFPSSERIEIGDNNIILERIDVLQKLRQQKSSVIVTYPKAIKEYLIDKTKFNKHQFKLKKGQIINQDTLVDRLEKLEFQNTEFVLEPGDFCIKGFIIDIFSYSNEYPSRIMLNNNTIEEISYFKVSDQISIKNLIEIDVVGNIEKIKGDFTGTPTTLFSYIPNNTNLWIHNANILLKVEDGRTSNYIDQASLRKLIDNYHCIYSGSINDKNYSNTILFDASAQPSFNKNFEILINHLNEYREKGYKNIITVSSKNQMNQLKHIFKNYMYLVDLVECENSLKKGFVDHANKIILYTDHEIFHRHHQYKSKRLYQTENTLNIKSLTDLKQGDYIVHFDYGIGMFDGLRVKKINNNTQESIRIIYKNNDVLYISIHSLHKISKYKDSEHNMQLDKLGSPRWKKLKEKIKGKIKAVAFDLIKLYAKRKMAKGFSFSNDTYLQHELEASFIFQDTEDQIKITNEIKSDMESEAPMDRLICGDVGFGKTELAIRAAFKAVADNKQVAVLVPTTILALQHFKTFENRLRDFPCNIEYINRFTPKKNINTILNKLEEGVIDIIIGTHRLISKDVHFHDLGLLIIDEEQKFGVSTKDKLKTLKEDVDTLTLTATPIPRTLQFSLMGSRDLSIMTTYPKNRNPIETVVATFNHDLIKEIITHEISRNGQVFFVHNRVANIEDMYLMLSSLCPNVSVKFAHGQMESKKLEKTILDFIHGKFDVLITTTIIENGLDIPNANTIVINNAQNFGLADLHQMRGRVGRSNKKAFCYLLTPPFNKVKDSAIKRLNAITNFASLGDGFNIAMKDLEIRGAGNMLGAEQSGFIEEMGFSNYQKLLDEAIVELKETKFRKSVLQTPQQIERIKCIIETDLELFIPTTYVSNTSERLNLYKRLSAINSSEQINNFNAELCDRFGNIPRPTIDLLKSIKLRELAEKINCEKIILKQNKMIVFFNTKHKLKSLSNSVLNNIIKLMQSSDQEKYSIKEEVDTIKVYANNITNIDMGLNIIKQIMN